MPIHPSLIDKVNHTIYDFQSIEAGEYMYKCIIGTDDIKILTTYCDESDFGGYVFLDTLEFEDTTELHGQLKVPIRLNDETMLGRIPMMQCFIVEIVDADGNESEYVFQHKTELGELITPS